MTAAMSAQTTRLNGRTVFWCAVGGLLLLQLWPFERAVFPMTELCYLTVLLLGAGALRVAERLDIVGDTNRWFLFFAAKVFIGALAVGWFWHLPLDATGYLRSATQDTPTTDATYYDYIGAYIARTGDVGALRSTWLSLGILFYISTLYQTFGIATLHVNLFNSLLVMIGILGLAGTMRASGKIPTKVADKVAWAMFLPYTAYVDISPSKEPLSDCALFLSIYAMATLGQSRSRYLLLFGCFVLCTLVRANLAVLIGIMFIVSIWRTYGARQAIVGTLLLSVLFVRAIAIVLDPSMLVDTLAATDISTRSTMQLDMLAAGGNDSPLKTAVATALQPRGIVDLIALFPIRTTIWYLLPYPLLLPDFSLWSNLDETLHLDPLAYFHAAEQVCRSASTVILIGTLPYLVQLVRKRSVLRDPFLVYAGGMFLLLLILISNLQFVNGGRYRVTIEPLGLVLAIYSAHVLGEPTKLKRLILFPLFGLALLASVMILVK